MNFIKIYDTIYKWSKHELKISKIDFNNFINILIKENKINIFGKVISFKPEYYFIIGINLCVDVDYIDMNEEYYFKIFEYFDIDNLHKLILNIEKNINFKCLLVSYKYIDIFNKIIDIYNKKLNKKIKICKKYLNKNIDEKHITEIIIAYYFKAYYI